VCAQCDRDLSGTIDVDELFSMFWGLGIRINFIQARAVMRAADTDGTGVLDFVEFVRVIQDYKAGKISGEALMSRSLLSITPFLESRV
jgi:hypothetical protein